MSASSLCRASGAALLLGAVLSRLGYLLKPVVSQDLSFYFSPFYLPSALLTLTGSLIMLIGLPEMYVFQAGRLVSSDSQLCHRLRGANGPGCW